MFELTSNQTKNVSGGVMAAPSIWSEIGSWFEGAYDDIQQWNQEMWSSMRGFVESQPGTPGCNALGDTMGAMSHVNGLPKGDSIELSHAGSVCQKAASAVNGSIQKTNQKYRVNSTTKCNARIGRSGPGAVACAASPTSGAAHGVRTPGPSGTVPDSSAA